MAPTERTATIRHVIMPIGDNDMSACGLAGDAFSTGDHDSDDEFVDARPGLRVTCPNCCDALRSWRKGARGLRLVPREDAP